MKKNHSFIFLAEGFEEIEALSVIDIMRRAGLDIKSVSITSHHEVTGAHGITVKADLTFKEADFDSAEWLITPGGMPGSTHLHDFLPLNDLLKVHVMNGGKLAAICAAPAVVLAPLGLLDGKEATCYPGFDGNMTGALLREGPVVSTKDVITANGPAAAMRFALAIVAASLGMHAAQEVGAGLLFYPKQPNFYF